MNGQRNNNQSRYGKSQHQQRTNANVQRSQSFSSQPSTSYSYISSNDSDDDNYQINNTGGNGGKRVRMRDVKMPAGTTVSVTIPAKTCNCGRGRCTFDYRLTELRPEGQFGRREYLIVASDMLSTIRRHAMNAGGRFTTYNIIKIQKVQNCCLWRRFRDCERRIAKNWDVNEKMLYHGTSAAENIVKNGFSADCARPDGMFGKAIYFAEHSSKSNQYVFGYLNGKGCPTHKDKGCFDCERKLLLCRVTLGKTLVQTQVNRTLPQGYNSVKGTPSTDGLRYPEYAIYEPAQAYPEYLITYTIAK